MATVTAILDFGQARKITAFGPYPVPFDPEIPEKHCEEHGRQRVVYKNMSVRQLHTSPTFFYHIKHLSIIISWFYVQIPVHSRHADCFTTTQTDPGYISHINNALGQRIHVQKLGFWEVQTNGVSFLKWNGSELTVKCFVVDLHH